MRKTINVRKALISTVITTALAGSLAACGSDTAAVDAAATDAVATPQAVTSVVPADAADEAAEALADRGTAASRSEVREAVVVKTAAQVRETEALAAQIESADLDHFRIENEDVENGTLAPEDLCLLSWTEKSIVRCDAANAFEHLNEAFKAEFGHDIEINDSYRSYEKQVEVREELGKIAAVPGYSNHGYAVALDLGSNIPDGDSAENNWMDEHAGDFGWVNPDWAKTTKIEPWHWEYVGFEA